MFSDDAKASERSGVMSFVESVKAYFLMFVIVVVGAVGGTIGPWIGKLL